MMLVPSIVGRTAVHAGRVLLFPYGLQPLFDFDDNTVFSKGFSVPTMCLRIMRAFEGHPAIALFIADEWSRLIVGHRGNTGHAGLRFLLAVIVPNVDRLLECFLSWEVSLGVHKL